MFELPRIAVGTIQPGADFRAMLWALMEAFRERGVQVQSFLSRACFARYHGTATASGLSPRHLDSWLMSPETARWIFVQGSRNCDLAVVHGRFDPARSKDNGVGGSLETLCQWLDLPRIVSLDVGEVADCRSLARPERIDAVLLDRFDDASHLARLSADLEGLWGVPVLGGLEALPELRAEIAATAEGTRPARDLCQRLGAHLLRSMQPQRVMQLASRRRLPWIRPPFDLLPEVSSSPLVVALAYDRAMNCYFPDTLDLMESRGATIIDFSPLRDERLPPDTDIVYVGCGHPEHYAAELSQNHCMKLALRNHLRMGGRIYAEGGGLAYLCQQIEVAEGETWRMAGIFPATARLHRCSNEPTPVEVTLDRNTWLGRCGARLRGYHIPKWQIEVAGGLTNCIAEPNYRNMLVKSSQAIGSLLHLNFALQPDLFTSFFRGGPSGPELPDPPTHTR